jgi:hypothetical protein
MSLGSHLGIHSVPHLQLLPAEVKFVSRDVSRGESIHPVNRGILDEE